MIRRSLVDWKLKIEVHRDSKTKTLQVGFRTEEK